MHLLNKKILVFVTGLILISAVAYYLSVSFIVNIDIHKPNVLIHIHHV